MSKAKSKIELAVEAAGVAAQVPLGRRIQALREQRALTQQALGDRVALSQKYISELERGTKSPSWETLVGLAQFGFEVKLATLVFGVDEQLDHQIQHVDELLAGRPAEARTDLLRAFDLVLRAGSK
jgi:transcriptional regulator with XRE-family HTH domain